MTRLRRIVLVLALASVTAGFAMRGRRGQSPSDLSGVFEKLDVMIPMRDGMRLHTEIYMPRNSLQPLPFIFERTPYGVTDDETGITTKFGIYREMVPAGYIFVFQDIRGRYKSEGQFVMLRRPRDPREPHAIDEGTDTNDTIDWLLKNVPHNNGRVGLLGISYGGWLTVMAMLEPHPALKATSEQASPDDMFLGDDFHHNGAFRLSYGFEYAAMMETGKTSSPFHFDRDDTFEWYLALGPLANVNAQYLHGNMPTWNDFIAHPNYDEYWRREAVRPYLKTITVPDLNVAGWWDQEDFFGPQKIYEALEKHDTRHWNYFVAGPWNHGGWASGAGSSLGQIPFGSETAKYFREKIQAAWFAYWLKDQGQLPFEKAMTFETGTNQWKTYPEWPPHQGIQLRKLYFQADGGLSFDPPAKPGAAGFDRYVSDPAHPVPYRHQPIQPTYPGGGWPTWLVEDQRFVQKRPDVLTWQSAPLTANLTVTGGLVARLFASTSGTDSDWIVKLIDVFPDDAPTDPALRGYELMIADEVFRGRFRESFEKPKPLTPNRVEEYVIDLHTNDHCFLRGHRIMVQVQSTWFPLIDRNPQKFVPNIFQANQADYQAATQRIYRTREFPSAIELPVEERHTVNGRQ
ncbi:MAG: CocE/NonD family hydrolase [Terriglobia bacterium]|jgi:putative CocE/NonD family hydrolase